jgi:hypothetical protein
MHPPFDVEGVVLVTLELTLRTDAASRLTVSLDGQTLAGPTPLASPDTLEAAARTVLGLITGLLGVLFAVLAVASDPLPGYLRLPLVRGLGVVTVTALLVALVGALSVVLPRRVRVASARPDEQADAFQRLLARKSRWLAVAVIAFGLGLVALGASLIVALLRGRPSGASHKFLG